MSAMKLVATFALGALALMAGNAHGANPATPMKGESYTVTKGTHPALKNTKQGNYGLTCDEGYECDFVVLDKNKGDLYQFNLNGLCAAKDYEADSIKFSNGKVKFNICGFSNDHCLPEGNPNVPYVKGVAIQYWGDEPGAQKCSWAPTGEIMECTRNCEVIGVGQPSFELMDPNNPETGGIKVAHRAAVASKVDPWECTVERGGESFAIERHATYLIECDKNTPIAEVVKAEEHPECHYKVTLKSQHACGEKIKKDLQPVNNGGDSNSPSNGNGGGSGAGIGAGMFFFGIFMVAALAGGYYWWRNRKSGYSPFGSTAAASTSESSGLRTTGTGGVGSSSL